MRVLSPTYRLLWGIPGRSNALTIARRLEAETEVVDAAKTHLGGTDDVNQVIAGLEAQRRQETRRLRRKVVAAGSEAVSEVSQKAAALQEREQALRQQQVGAVQQAIAQAKAEIAQVIRQLQQGSATAQAASKQRYC